MEDAGILIRAAFNNKDWEGRCIDPVKDKRCYICRNIDVQGRDSFKSEMRTDEQGLCYFEALRDNWMPISWVRRINPGQRIVNGYRRIGGKNVPSKFVYIKCGERIQDACAEQFLCTKYWWENFEGEPSLHQDRSPIVSCNAFSSRARVGQQVFFVFRQPRDRDRQKYTLWGKSWVEDIVDHRKRIVFEPFEPLPEDKWRKDLYSYDLIGKPWGNGTYRYVDTQSVTRLNSLI